MILTVNVVIIIGFLGRVRFSHGSTILTLISTMIASVIHYITGRPGSLMSSVSLHSNMEIIIFDLK